MVKAIYSGFTTAYWQKVAEQLADESDWQPVYWIADPEMKAVVKSRFPRAIFHSVFDAVKGVNPLEYSDRLLNHLDSKIFAESASYQGTLLRMMDRIDALGSFDYNNRVRLMHHLLMY